MTETSTLNLVKENVMLKIFYFPRHKILVEGITDEDKKDLVHWMAYREKRPPSPSPETVLEKMKQQPNIKGKDRFLECKLN